ncbi:MAG: FMN-binding protein [Eubacteriales bacterium]|nr:FMN-binding protein [Eubacteriales bacterium]MDD4138981.1 FMN-binding protein [Eubacteriales bacterium]NLO34845.1 FMN-binding protein [Clostridiaceae bacterium]
MKHDYLNTIVFILVLSLVFGGVLAGTNAWLRPRIVVNEQIAEKRAVLDAFGLDATGDAQAIAERFDSQIQTETQQDLAIYSWFDTNGSTKGYAVPFSGAGLWGTIRGYLAVSADLKTVLGLTFVEQNETPGLGGRIDEPAFKEQFRNLSIDLAQGFAYGDQLDAITGATSTSRAVLQILNGLLQQTLAEWEVA